MKVDQTINRVIDKRLVAKSELRKKLHKRSGKLSAGRLGEPVLWQILHSLGVPKKKLDPYVLRKFARGDDVEDWLGEFIPGKVDEQFYIEYRGVVGYADYVVDSSEYDFKNGVVPMEIKSVTNASFKWLKKSGPKEHHALQAVCYALGMQVDHALLAYVASDDYRIKCYVLDVGDYKKKIDQAIDEYDQAMADWKKDQVLPAFKAKQKWQEDPKYSQYPDFAGKAPQVVAKEVISFLGEGGEDR